MTTLNSFKYYLPALLWAAVIFGLSSLKSDQVPSFGLSFEDLLAHFIVYALLGYFLCIAIVRSELTRNKIIVVLLVGWLYGFSDEMHQLFVSGRVASWSDWLADAVGICFGSWLFARLPQVFRSLDRRFFT